MRFNEMQIQIDSREKAKAIKKIVAEFEKQKIKIIESKLFVGDYMNYDNPRLIIDRKQNLSEVYNNLCQGHKRFKAELQRAIEHDIKLIVLVEHSNLIKNIEDVKNWNNPRLKYSPYAWSGDQLFKTMRTIEKKYDTQFMFCSKANTGKKIIELLG
jgi:ERCC4-type nuclease